MVAAEMCLSKSSVRPLRGRSEEGSQYGIAALMRFGQARFIARHSTVRNSRIAGSV